MFNESQGHQVMTIIRTYSAWVQTKFLDFVVVFPDKCCFYSVGSVFETKWFVFDEDKLEIGTI